MHNVKDLRDEIERNIFVKKIAHRIHKNRAGLPPAKRYFESVGMKCYFEAVSVVGASGGLQTQRHAFGIAVFTARADFRTTGNGIPRRFSPFDFRVLRHIVSTKNTL